MNTDGLDRYEVDLDERIGMGYFSDVFKGSWHGRTVAIKALAPSTPKKAFVHEMAIWKTLHHPNVQILCGASSTSGDPPWFFVSPYCKVRWDYPRVRCSFRTDVILEWEPRDVSEEPGESKRG
jgi:serine/threonine protein kinase